MTAKLYSKSDCGYAFSDLFFSRTERCIEFEKRKIVNINVLSLVLNYLNQMLNVFVETFNKFSYWSQLWFILSGSFFVVLIIALIVVYPHPSNLDHFFLYVFSFANFIYTSFKGRIKYRPIKKKNS